MDSFLNSLILSSLFHDLGKFFQRTKYFEDNHDQISKFFIDIIEGKIDELKKIEIIDKDIDFDLVKKLILDHHKNEEEIEGSEDYKKIFKILKKSDRLSALRERENQRFSNDEPYLVNQKDIFEYLFKDKGDFSNFYYHKISSVYNFEKNYFFPNRIEKKLENENVNSYKELISKNNFGWLFKSFINRKVTFLNFLYFIDEIFYFILSHIPEDRRDIYQLNSLYDHLKLTTLYAYCFYYDEDKAYIFKYDIAGIQKFIFDIKIKKASQMLRGRSFFIQIITEIINYYLIKKLDLIPQTNVSCFGGNSIFLIPKIKNIEEKIKSLFLSLNNFFIYKFGFYLRYDLKLITIQDDFFNFTKTNLDPQLDTELFFQIFRLNQKNNYSRKEDFNQCEICGSYEKKYSIKFDEEISLCPVCYFIFNLASKIRDGDFIKFNIAEFENLLLEKNDDFNSIIDTKLENKINNSPSDYYFYIKPFDNLKERLEKKREFFFNSPSKTIFYKISQPEKNNKNLSFEEIARKSEGGSFLVYLKADVDSMSEIFNQGFKFRSDKEKYTKITDKLHFSRRINLFFQNYLSLLIEKKYKDYIYLIYSGGDDIFLTGAWNKVLEFIFDLKSEFDEFVCYNNKIHFSAGAILTKSDFPVYFAFEKTEEKLHLAKNNGKNKFAFLYSIENYEDFKKIFDLGGLIGRTFTISTSFLYKIYKLSDYFENSLKYYQQAVNFYKMIYFFERNFNEIKNPKNQIEKENKENHNKAFIFFKNFFDKFLSRNFDEDFDFIKRNLKTIINLSLLYRRD